MRKIREVLRLKFDCGRSNREIGLSCDISGSTVCEYIQRSRSSGIGWPLPADLSDAALERLLFPSPPPQSTERSQPDFAEIHRELRKSKHVTLHLLWQEYRERKPDG